MSVVEEAIWLLELYGSNDLTRYPDFLSLIADADASDGAVDISMLAWRSTVIDEKSMPTLERWRLEALEAAARLREGWLP